jgi:hypothetical protein
VHPLDLEVASKGWDMLFQYHGRPSGAFAADEYLAGLEAVRGYIIAFAAIMISVCLTRFRRTELCLVVVRPLDLS